MAQCYWQVHLDHATFHLSLVNKLWNFVYSSENLLPGFRSSVKFLLVYPRRFSCYQQGEEWERNWVRLHPTVAVSQKHS
jgi:hypothetical protein